MEEYSSEEIGYGAFGRVFLLTNGNAKLVMKEIECVSPANELEILKELVHPNIVKYRDKPIDYVYQGGCFPIFMEFCEEGSLRNVIDDQNLFYTVATVIQWAKEMFTALIYLDDRKIIHQDIKPENIFVNKEFVLKIGDFGIMRRNGDGVDGGTLPYMPPKTCQADDEPSHKTDVFAAGLVLWEVIERRKLKAPLIPISFTKISLELVELHGLVKSCSDRSIPLWERFNGNEALEVVESLEKEEGGRIPSRKTRKMKGIG